MRDYSDYPLLDAILHRRSRRFARGVELSGGPLSYRSPLAPQPLTIEEEALLAFAACGITGPALAELPYDQAGGGNIMAQFAGRTVASGDALHTVTVFVTNDDGAWMLRRPQDFPPEELAGLAEAARQRRFVELYERSRVRIADRRIGVPREVPYVPVFNQWMANVPGCTYIVPVSELSALYINILLTAFSPEFGYFVVDDRNGFAPAGIARFAKSQGGHLHDDFSAGRVATIDVLETWLCEFTTIEMGGIQQNLALMAQALGLGGFPHFAAHPFAWTQALGFRLEASPLPTAVGLERDGECLLKPYCPPYYRDMREAVLAFLDSKYAAGTGAFRDGGSSTGWRDPVSVQSGIASYADETIEAAIAYATYVHERYGRFPAKSGPFRTVTNYQAHHLDPSFYDMHYKPGALSDTQLRATATTES